MYDVEKLVSIVAEYLEAVEENKKFNLELRKQKGWMPDTCIWIPSLDGSNACRLGELYGREQQRSFVLADICAMLDIDQDRLIAAVKSMQRKERHNGRWDNPDLTCWMGQDDKKRLCRFLSNERGESDYHPWYSSTGRKKAWCE